MKPIQCAGCAMIGLLLMTGCGRTASPVLEGSTTTPTPSVVSNVEPTPSPTSKAEQQEAQSPSPSVGNTKDAPSTEKEGNQETGSTPAPVDTDSEMQSVTPYQYLNLMLGNAEDLSMTYTVLNHEDKETRHVYYGKAGDKIVSEYTAQDTNGKSIHVQELEMDGFVYYVMRETKQIKRYTAPAEDFLMTEMMAVTPLEPSRKEEAGGVVSYTYQKPFEQDDGITLHYTFRMKNNQLAELVYGVDEMTTRTYTFTSITQDPPAGKQLLLPDGYKQFNYDTPYSMEHMPPWWEKDE